MSLQHVTSGFSAAQALVTFIAQAEFGTTQRKEGTISQWMPTQPSIIQ